MDESAARHLWLAVLWAGALDEMDGKATGWVGTEDFEIVCALAGLEPGHVMEMVSERAIGRKQVEGRAAEHVSLTLSLA